MHGAGELNAREFTYACGKTTTVVDIEEARKLTSSRHEPLNLRETSRLLCLSRTRIEQLIGSGVLKLVSGCPHAGEMWLVYYSSIVALAPARFLTSLGVNFIMIFQVAKNYLPTLSGLIGLVIAIKKVNCRYFAEQSQRM